MIDVDFICKVLDPQAVVKPVKDVNGFRYVPLKETDPLAKLKSVHLYGVSADAVAIKLDCGDPSVLFTNKGGQRKRCDYVVATEYNGKNILFYIDLKSGHVDGDVERQLKGGVCLVKYIGAVMELFHGKKDFFVRFDESRFVVFYKPPHLHKMTSRTQKAPRNTTVERFYKCPNTQKPWVSQLV